MHLHLPEVEEDEEEQEKDDVGAPAAATVSSPGQLGGRAGSEPRPPDRRRPLLPHHCGASGAPGTHRGTVAHVGIR